jgi:hypothetical protein
MVQETAVTATGARTSPPEQRGRHGVRAASKEKPDELWRAVFAVTLERGLLRHARRDFS